MNPAKRLMIIEDAVLVGIAAGLTSLGQTLTGANLGTWGVVIMALLSIGLSYVNELRKTLQEPSPSPTVIASVVPTNTTIY